MRASEFKGDEAVSLQRATQEETARIGAKPYLRSKAIFVTLVAGVVAQPHGLKRKPVGWMIHTVLGPASVYVATAPDTANIPITSTAPGSCFIEVW